MGLALEFRPATFEDVVGQKHIKPILKAMIAKDDLPPALLFSGSRGTGKTSTARILAAALNCSSTETRPCTDCPQCVAIAKGSSLDVIEVDAASNGLVADIRKIKDAVMYAQGGKWRVVLLDEAHCSPYDEPVLTQNGFVPIGDLDPETHRLVSYKPSYGLTGDSSHANAMGSHFTKGVRRYRGDLLKIETAGSSTRVTPNHVVRVKLNERFYDRWVVYLMRRGNWWRVGLTASHTKYKPSGISRRMSKERADSAWILGVYGTRQEAFVAEQTFQAVYGVPGLIFNTSSSTTNEELASVHNASAPAVNIRVKSLLDDQGLLEDQPLYTRGKNDKRLWFDTAAANLKVLNELFNVPVRVEGKRFPQSQQASISAEDFDGDVYSLDVQPYHYYVSGGAVVHNSMSKEAFNALLKVLEEPPPKTLFILLTTEPNKILDTVLSRTMAFEYRRLTTADIVNRLRYIVDVKELVAEDEMLLEIAQRSQGGMRDAVMLLDQVSRVEVSTLKGFRELFGITDTSLAIFESALAATHHRGAALIEEHFFTSGDASALVNDLVSLVRDLLIVRAGGALTNYSEADIDERNRLAQQVGVDRLVSVIKVLWDLKNRVRAVDNDQRSAMHMAYILISEAVSPTVPTQSSVMAGPDPKMTLEQMRSMAAR